MTPGFIWTLALLWTITQAEAKSQDVQVTCFYARDCILPCIFSPVGGEVVRWYRPGNSLILSSDRNDTQEQNYVGKVVLFEDQVALGNGSLLLQHCLPQDRGRYRCRVTGQQEAPETTVTVRVEAPMRSLTLETTRLSGYEEVLCSTRNVYPAPNLAWSTEPPTAKNALKHTTHKRETKGLYTLESKLRKLRGTSSLTYVCTVTAAYGAQTWRASLSETEVSNTEGGDLILPCRAPKDLHNFTLTWYFLPADHPLVILTYNSSTQWTAKEWADRAQLDGLRWKAGDGSLKLQNPQSSEHSGTYTCSFTAHQNTHVVHIRVNVTATRGEKAEREAEASSSWWIAAVVVAVLAIAMAAVVGILKLRADCSQSEKRMEEATMMHPIRDEKDAEISSENFHLAEHQSDGHT
ncbi:CD276 antigen homolog [Sardina pilchardus]|uniref:CD276 antigen homolog n=1 Tax=Sardina pilchardus TaxID=27697 RepID=UPI002E154E71